MLAFACGLVDDLLRVEEGSGPLLYLRDPEGARVLLSTVAGSMITVAGVAFSITVIALSLASSQLGPRLLDLSLLPRRPGQFVVMGDTLLEVRGELDDAVAGRLRSCFLLGRHRTAEADVEYGVHQLVEVDVRAHSPGINDPHTAISCVDWLGAALSRVGARPIPSALRRGPEGDLRLVEPIVTFEGMLAAALGPIRQAARTTPSVSIQLLETLATIAGRVDHEDHRAAVQRQADMVLAGAVAESLRGPDRQALEGHRRAVTKALGAALRE